MKTMQLSLLQKADNVKEIHKKAFEKSREEEIKIALERLTAELYLWDMRCWDKYKDKKEVEEYVETPTHKNSGHSAYCVKKLKEMGISKEVIINAIMKNPHKQYKNRIVKCLINPEKCPKLRKQGNYGNNICDGCE